MQIFFDELKPYDKPNETLYLRFTKEDFPGLRKQFKNLSSDDLINILNNAYIDLKTQLELNK